MSPPVLTKNPARSAIPLLFALLLTACTVAPAAETVQPDPVTPAPAHTPARPTALPAEAMGPLPAATPTPTPGPDDWKDAPVIPVISENALAIYQRGLELGNDPHVFSKLGDCETFTTWFLTPFDQQPQTYDLGPYTELEAVITYYAGSFARPSMAARPGFNASSVFAPLWADPERCEVGETPLACEFRLNQPSMVLIMFGTNDLWHQEEFELQMRRMIEFSIEAGVVPILSTKADNLEGDESINRTIYALALEYDIPLWNFWGALQDLPQQGLDDDGAHLTFAANRFGDPQALLAAWPVRNLTALQVLEAFRTAADS
ncbi:MAG: hypothetical protein JXA97_09340 [Anaerolineales bacterium]|nr:hypothetical protein [Anaerolineales bacterium]